MKKETENKTKSVNIKAIKENDHKLTAKDAIEAFEKAEKKEVTVIDDAVLVPVDYKSKMTRQQIELIKRMYAKSATDDELRMFMYVVDRTKLDPFTRQIYFVKRWNSTLGIDVATVQTSIDGFRSIAERTGNYAGNDDPIFDDEENPKKATVSVYKIVQGIRVPFTATARWEQYYPGDRQGFMWKKMPHLMLGKCAEGLALRKAFPAVMSGLYVAEELQQAQGGAVLTASGSQNEPESDFDKAIRMIKGTTDAKGLAGMKSKIVASEKYTMAEKNKIGKAIDARVAELMANKMTLHDKSSGFPEGFGGDKGKKIIPGQKKVEKIDESLPSVDVDEETL